MKEILIKSFLFLVIFMVLFYPVFCIIYIDCQNDSISRTYLPKLTKDEFKWTMLLSKDGMVLAYKAGVLWPLYVSAFVSTLFLSVIGFFFLYPCIERKMYKFECKWIK